MGLLSETGDELHADTLVFTQPEQSFVFDNIAAKPVVSLFRNFSAPVKLKGQSLATRAFLAAHDTDLFNRWDALQDYAAQILLAQIAGGKTPLDAGLANAFAAILQDAATDPAFAAEALLLPGENLLADQMAQVDPDAIHAIRSHTRQQLGAALKAEFLAVMRTVEPTDISAAAMAQRALNNTALGYLCAAGETHLAEAQFAAAGNMTESLAALALLAEAATPARDAALETFYARWKSTPLVLDKWFSVQARASAPDTLARVKSLADHPDFDLRNPNRVRSLIGAFAANQAQFHTASGAGYTMLADTIIALDAKNPQIAARLTTGLGTWRRFDPARQALMKAALERILAVAGLSRNSYEMASKSLA